METAITAFLITMGVVAGILSPILLVAFFGMIGNGFKALAAKLEAKTIELKKQPPFDEVEVNVNPATNVMTARFIKNGSVVWQGASSRRELEENETLTFTTQEVEQ